MIKTLAQQLGMQEQARAAKSALGDAALKLRQKIGLAPSTHKVPFGGRDVSFPLHGTHAKLWFERYQGTTQNGWHEPSLTRLLEVLAHDKTCLIDIGAHLGYFSALFASGPGRTAHAIELNPKTFALLENTLRDTQGLEGQALAVNAGMSDTQSEVQIGPSTTSPTFSLVSENTAPTRGARARVKVTTLDRFCEDTGAVPDVIKIDVEGFERHVWRGGQRTIQNHRPILMIELHPPQLQKQGIETAAFIREIENSDYAVFTTKEHRSLRAAPFFAFETLPTVANFDILCVPKQSDFLPDLGGLRGMP